MTYIIKNRQNSYILHFSATGINTQTGTNQLTIQSITIQTIKRRKLDIGKKAKNLKTQRFVSFLFVSCFIQGKNPAPLWMSRAAGRSNTKTRRHKEAGDPTYPLTTL